MGIEEVRRVSEELVDAMARLLPQLSPGSPPPRAEWLERVVRDPDSVLLIARGEDGAIVGTLTLAWYPIPTGLRAWIEDVVVDQGARGRGVGEALVREAVERARALGAADVRLTSNPDREAANRLYQRLGFQRRETNSYRYHLTD